MAETAVKIRPAAPDIDDGAWQKAVDEAIAAFGDARAAVRALLIANCYLEAARDRALDMISRGYVRGRLPDQSPIATEANNDD
jgi:hypothetical protein